MQYAKQKDFYTELLRIPSIQTTTRLPATVLFHIGMRMRFATTLHQPFAVQDVDCTVVGFDPDDLDKEAHIEMKSQCRSGVYAFVNMPKAIYVKIDECHYRFLPPAPCSVHRLTGRDASCLSCIRAVQPGIFAVKPLIRKFSFFYYPVAKSKYIEVQRKQFPLVPASAMP